MLVFVWFLIVEPLVSGLYDTVGRGYLPGAALTQLAGQSGRATHTCRRGAGAVGMALFSISSPSSAWAAYLKRSAET